MTRRERYMRILRKETADTVVWAPNFDHWLTVNRANGTLPAAYQGMSRNDVVRAVDATIWARSSVLKSSSPNVKVKKNELEDKYVRTEYQTPLGSVETLHVYASDMTQALFLKEHMIKRPEDVKVVRYLVEDVQYELAPDAFLECEAEVGDDGITVVGLPYCMPYIQFGKTDAGWERGIYLWQDHREEVEGLMEAYSQSVEEAAKIIAASPATVVQSGDNMDQWTTSPPLFREYGLPHYQRIARILHGAGKIFQGHWCGRTGHLLPMVQEAGLDVIEAVTVAPMDNLTIPEALDLAGDHVVIQGGIPSVSMCEQGGSRDELRDYVEELLSQVPLGRRFVLGMSDNVPPDADFERVRIISDIVNSLPRAAETEATV